MVTPEEAARPLWRAMRGELPRAFWVPDRAGMVCVVDMAFMSTSRTRETPIAYMAQAGSGGNVMWNLKPGPETDEAYHAGADVSMLSQFGAEEEVLFPPCTMLEVKQSLSLRAAVDAVMDKQAGEHQHLLRENGREFVAVDVTPSFI